MPAFTLTVEKRGDSITMTERGRLRMRDFLSKRPDGLFRLILERRHSTKAAASLQQRRLYFGGYVETFAAHFNKTPDDMHQIFKQKFLPIRHALCDHQGVVLEEFVIGGSTRELNIVEFSEYLDAIKGWADALGIELPKLEAAVG